MSQNNYKTYDELNARLNEIADTVSNENISLDDALTLYEEAVGLGLRGCEMLEVGISENEAKPGENPEQGQENVQASETHEAKKVQQTQDNSQQEGSAQA